MSDKQHRSRCVLPVTGRARRETDRARTWCPLLEVLMTVVRQARWDASNGSASEVSRRILRTSCRAARTSAAHARDCARHVPRASDHSGSAFLETARVHDDARETARTPQTHLSQGGPHAGRSPGLAAAPAAAAPPPPAAGLAPAAPVPALELTPLLPAAPAAPDPARAPPQPSAANVPLAAAEAEDPALDLGARSDGAHPQVRV
jgi:hypothetical protein